MPALIRFFAEPITSRITDPDPELQRNIDNFGFSGRDPSRIGGVDPDLNPLGGGR
jgi:hypothetical protein